MALEFSSWALHGAQIKGNEDDDEDDEDEGIFAELRTRPFLYL